MRARCAFCQEPSSTTVPDGPVCRQHAIEYWSELLVYARERRALQVIIDARPVGRDQLDVFKVLLRSVEERRQAEAALSNSVLLGHLAAGPKSRADLLVLMHVKSRTLQKTLKHLRKTGLVRVTRPPGRVAMWTLAADVV